MRWARGQRKTCPHEPNKPRKLKRKRQGVAHNKVGERTIVLKRQTPHRRKTQKGICLKHAAGGHKTFGQTKAGWLSKINRPHMGLKYQATKNGRKVVLTLRIPASAIALRQQRQYQPHRHRGTLASSHVKASMARLSPLPSMALSAKASTSTFLLYGCSRRPHCRETRRKGKTKRIGV